jgi:putative Mg2+ transporter-C (MgtC) family protein
MVEGMAALDWYDVLARLAMAAFLGALLGLEREVDGQEAGLRTHLLLALGAALFGSASVGAFTDFTAAQADTNVQVDVTRIASYVPAGVGFIGGGVILKHVGMVKGITTAASLWCTAAVGLVAGLGFWIAAIGGTLLGLFALAGLKPASRLAGRLARKRTAAIVVELQPGSELRGVVSLIDELGRQNLKQLLIGSGQIGGTTEIRAEFWDAPDTELLAGLLDRLGQQAEVRAVFPANRP